jgi:hypothetical protein
MPEAQSGQRDGLRAGQERRHRPGARLQGCAGSALRIVVPAAATPSACGGVPTACPRGVSTTVEAGKRDDVSAETLARRPASGAQGRMGSP